MPGLAFEDDEEPGGHATQHEEQLAQVGLQVTLGSMRQASSQLLMMAVKSSVRNLITPHLTFLPPSVSLESVDDSEKMLPVPIYLRCHVAVIPRMKLTPSSSFTLIRTSGDACILRHRPPPPDPLSHGNLRWVLHFIITSARNHKMHDSGK